MNGPSNRALTALDCKVRYHVNYTVCAATSSRVYYMSMPAVVEVAEHAFLDAPLLEWIANSMVFGQ